MSDRGFTQGQISVDYSRHCIRCRRPGVVVDPKSGKSGRLCAECFISAMSNLFLLSEAHDLLIGEENGE